MRYSGRALQPCRRPPESLISRLAGSPVPVLRVAECSRQQLLNWESKGLTLSPQSCSSNSKSTGIYRCTDSFGISSESLGCPLWGRLLVPSYKTMFVIGHNGRWKSSVNIVIETEHTLSYASSSAARTPMKCWCQYLGCNALSLHSWPVDDKKKIVSIIILYLCNWAMTAW